MTAPLEKALITLTALMGAIGVGMGAFGAHALADRLEAAAMTSVWETAVLYHLIHTVAAFAALGWAAFSGLRGLRTSALLWIIGIVLFSGSLYLLALDGPRWLGPITPFGGLALIASWIVAGVAALRTSQPSSVKNTRS